MAGVWTNSHEKTLKSAQRSWAVGGPGLLGCVCVPSVSVYVCVSGGTEGYVGAKQNRPWQQRRKRTGAPKGQTASGAGRARPSNVIYVWRPLAKLWSACAATCIGENLNRGHGTRGGVPLRWGGQERGRAVSPMTRGHAPPPREGPKWGLVSLLVCVVWGSVESYLCR